MAKILEREKAKKLRKKGFSIGDIANKISVSKSTVSYWCRDITLSPKQIEHIEKQHKKACVGALLTVAERRRIERIIQTKKSRERGMADVGKISKRDLFMIGLALYWGEGYKKGNEEFGFTNSDPKMIEVAIKWLEDIYNVKKDYLILRVSINQTHEKRGSCVVEYWSKITRVPITQFTKTSFIKTKSKKIYPNHDEHFGTLRIKIRKGAGLRRQVLGSISAIEDTIN